MIRIRTGIAAIAPLAAVLAWSGALRAQVGERTGVGVGGRVGFFQTLGTVVHENTTGDIAAGDVLGVGFGPAIEVGYRITPAWYVGGIYSGAWYSVKHSDRYCPSGYDCDASTSYFGALGTYTFDTTGSILPWVGFGFGQRELHYGMTVPLFLGFAPHLSWTYSGLEADGMFGVDFDVGGVVRLGPMIDVGVGKYTDTPNPFQTGESSTTHETIFLGVRAEYDIVIRKH
jgi:hypothetical protein